MCREKMRVAVMVPGGLAWEGVDTAKVKGIDACIAPIVEALAAADIRTSGSCCGHGRRDGSIVLQDGRELLVTPKPESERGVFA